MAKQHDTAATQPALTVREAVLEYLADRKAEGQDTAHALQQLEAHVLPRWGEVRIADLTAPALKAWRDELVMRGPRLRRSRGAAETRHADVDLDNPEVRRRRRSAVNRLTTTFKAALNFAERMHADQCPNADAWREGLRAFRNVDTPRERWLKPDEVRALLRACDTEFEPLVRAALYTGCRYGELCRALVRHYDVALEALLIPASKSGKWRHVFVHAEAAAFFEATCRGREPDERLFTRGDPPRPWGRAHQIRPMADACRRGRIEPPISFHGLRHTYASLAVQSGMALVALARNLGHADTRMVEKHYGHLSDRYMREQVRQFAPVL